MAGDFCKLINSPHSKLDAKKSQLHFTGALAHDVSGESSK